MDIFSLVLYIITLLIFGGLIILTLVWKKKADKKPDKRFIALLLVFLIVMFSAQFVRFILWLTVKDYYSWIHSKPYSTISLEFVMSGRVSTISASPR